MLSANRQERPVYSNQMIVFLAASVFSHICQEKSRNNPDEKHPATTNRVKSMSF